MHYTDLFGRIADRLVQSLRASLNTTPRMSRGAPHDAD